jgi:tetratricopeptide (TPR) repeat protein
MTATFATGRNSSTGRLDDRRQPAGDDHLGTISIRAWRVVFAVVVAVAVGPTPSAQGLVATDLLDRYFRGEFEAVIATLGQVSDFDDLLKQLKQDGPAWIDAGGAAARERRELAAATLALEVARLGQWTEWKHRELYPVPTGANFGWYDENGKPYIAESLWWEAPPLLIEWGCALFRRDDALPDPLERLWQLAALAVAQRSEDFEFLYSEGVTKLYNPKAEIDHLVHARARFPNEPRFWLAEGTVMEWRLQPRAIKVFERLEDDPDVGAEARMRMGAIYFRQRNDDRAIALFEQVKPMTRDPWVVYLAEYFKGQALERRKRQADAERAYRGAVAAVPGAQAASVALAALLFQSDRRTEASDLITTMLARRPRAVDPWRGYAHADDRFWPLLIARLRAEIRR